MRKLRFKLTALFMLLIGLSVLAAGIFTGKSYKDNHQDALRDHMVKELRVLIAAAPWPLGETEAAQRTYLQEQAAHFKQIADMRVTYIRTDGIVLGDSDHAPETMDNHLTRKEVKQALASGVGSSIRHSDTLGQNMLYVAMTVRDGAGQTEGVIRLAMSLKEVERSLGNMWLALIAGLAIVFAIAALVSYRVALGVTRPLERMTDAAKRMADMDYAIRIPAAGKDEVSELARALNAMAASLQGQMDELRQNETQLQSVLDNMISGVVMIGQDGKIQLYNRSAELLLGSSAKERVGRSYTEAKQQYELLQIIREALETHEPLHEELTVYYPEERLLELNLVPMRMGEDTEPGLLLVLQDVTAIRRLERMRSEFVANVSHELKTPVAAVKGFAETLLAGAVNDPETAQSFLTIIHDESERLNRLIGDILELSKIESRRSPLQFSPVDLKIFLERLMEFMRTEAAKKSIEMELQVEEELFLEADEDRLGQILLNLLQNGINYTPDGGRVKIVAEYVEGEAEAEGEDRVRITVSDTGIGIPKKDIPRIFERFYRVDKARSRSSGGTGLGLSIVKHLVELHHGSIRVESTVGVGTRFIIELPLLQP
ncbi:two-component system histidine kinase PnpS [Cohnella sp. REN36]|uniref:two-component system histidine kinase PnpS n=1 Tax=Cohnella sp. REN36 TaxID=2887347 RepID=UPI001D1418A2|nr:ATP-binding protein [Cohnella sp. REN36]MCC3375887.1 cell wall metabolism sensor histidine kinase WalK [Cohnella sp. REN36]